MKNITPIFYENVLGDTRDEIITVEKGQNTDRQKGKPSDYLVIMTPNAPAKEGQLPTFYSSYTLPLFNDPKETADRFGMPTRSRFEIDNIIIADFDGDGYKDIQYSATEYVSAETFKLFRKNKFKLTRQATLFHKDIASIIGETNSKTLDTDYNTRLRVDQLERQMRGWSSSGLSREIDYLKRRLETIEQILEEQENHSNKPSGKNTTQGISQLGPDLDDLEYRIWNIESDIEELQSNFDDLEGRISDLE